MAADDLTRPPLHASPRRLRVLVPPAAGAGDARLASTPAQHEKRAQPPPAQTVLILEGEPTLSQALAGFLGSRYALIPVTTPMAAQAWIAADGRPDALLLCDGPDAEADTALWNWLSDTRPELLRKAVALRHASTHTEHRPSRVMLVKPVDGPSLLRALATCARPALRKVSDRDDARRPVPAQKAGGEPAPRPRR